jgi:hypothetical protein
MEQRYLKIGDNSNELVKALIKQIIDDIRSNGCNSNELSLKIFWFGIR